MKIQDLHQRFLECNAVCTDTRSIKAHNLFFALKGDNFNGNTFAEKALEAGAKYAVVDEAVYKTSDQIILVDDVLKTLQKLAAYHRTYLNIPIIGLTGSNGKTTTKELINAVLSQSYKTTATAGNLNNHIGVPLTLLSMTKSTEIGIVEMGANHLKEIAFLSDIVKPNYGYITNFGKAHLEGFGSMAGVVKGKTELYEHLFNSDGLAFINARDSKQIEMASKLKTYTFGYGTSKTDVEISMLSADPFVEIGFNNQTITSHLIGSYNFNNISAAIAIGHYFKVSDQQIKNAIENYNPKNNRSQIIQKKHQKIILDAYNANPTSMRAALDSFSKLKDPKKVAIIGDMYELGKDTQSEHQDIITWASDLEIDKIIVIGAHFYATEFASDKLLKYETFEDFDCKFNNLDLKNTTLFIKASRGMRLERILDLL